METAEQAIDRICTHICRIRPNLKLAPATCEKRRSKRPNPMISNAVHPFPDCIKCEGPIERVIEMKEEIKQKPAPIMLVCEDCGCQYEEYTRGFTKPKVCKPCFNKKVKDGVYRGVVAKAESVIAEKKSHITLYFDEADDWMLIELKELAAKQRRTPEDQLLIILEDKFGGE